LAVHQVSWVKFLGAILLIVGTTIGAGMLALPMATATMGFLPALFYMILIWLLMTLAALLILEVNACLPLGNHLISMARATIGRLGQTLAWITYLFLLYCLLSAYIAGGLEVVSTVFSYMHIHISKVWSAVIFTLLFSGIVYIGIQSVDWANRLVMAIKLVAYFAMIIFAVPLMQTLRLLENATTIAVTSTTIMIIVTSFGFAIIVPSLKIYFRDNTSLLRKAVIIGSCVPLIFYGVWEAVIFSVLPSTGPYSLHALAVAKYPVATLMQVLSHISNSTHIIVVANVFTSVCVITAFLGASLCLIDFLADGLQMQKRKAEGILLYLITFVPPFLLAIFAQKVFISGLSYAGLACVFLLIFLPAWMAWAGRYQRHLIFNYQVFGGKPVLLALMLISIVLMIVEILSKLLSWFPLHS